jgi:protein disulfide-isomerase A1
MNFATIDATAYGFFAEALGLVVGRFPALVIEDVMSGETKLFDQNEEITADAIGRFVESYFRAKKAAKEEIKVQFPSCVSVLLV